MEIFPFLDLQIKIKIQLILKRDGSQAAKMFVYCDRVTDLNQGHK